MPKTQCYNCGGEYTWSWTEAFEKFGFGDGDGQVMTHHVVAVLQNAGYEVESHPWGLHNELIDIIRKNGRNLIPAKTNIGIADPRAFLPRKIVELLDTELPDDEEVQL